MRSSLLKKLVSGIICGLVFTLSANLTAFAAFTDLNSTHPNYEAITYLQQTGVLNGYSDGSFRPDNTVNRTEFLKIILEGSNIALDANQELTFPDTDNYSWYAPYLRKAVKEGWVQGYPDGTFRPSQTINKVEALKILGEVQDWKLATKITRKPFDDTWKTAWYTPYVAYAKNANYLEEIGPLFYPDDLMTRANISEIIYRTLSPYQQDTIIEDTVIDKTEIEFTENDTEEDTEDISETESSDYFDGLTLYESIPSNIYQNEVFIISGEVDSSSTEYATIVIQNANTQNIETYYGLITNREFEIPVYFPNTGSFNIGVVSGESGQSRAYPIEVRSNLPGSNDQEAIPSGIEFSIDYENDQTFINFSGVTSQTVKRITFTQGTKTVSYLNRQNKDKVPVNYADFENFSESSVTVKAEAASLSSKTPLKISSNFNSAGTKTITAAPHNYDLILDDKITASPPDFFTSSQKKISVTATALVDIQKNGYIIKPDGFVEKVSLSTTGQTFDYYGNELIKAGSNVTFTYSPTSSGLHIIEINDKEGIAVLNHPIYKESTMPLIPDFFDLNNRVFYSGTSSLSSLRSQLLNYINDSREDLGLSPITTSSDLNTLAQNHAQDMADNNYFSHINLSGQTPDDRRVTAGITTPVSENIAKDTGIAFAHFGLMRSGSHRENILNPDWERVGLGIAEDNGYLIIAEEFSTDELDATDLAEFKNELNTEINNIRSDLGLNELSYNTNLENVSKYLNDKVIIDGVSITNGVFNDALETYSITGNSQAVGRVYSIWNTILESITEDEAVIIEAGWDQLGIDIQLDDSGNINTIVVLNEQ
ncbi:hypothetical protein GF354_05730 [Candidatus Peregrinibacteria bacterium]|nr:hypothetical protein [Candidatus Peregrinibacteria bacterium]